MFQREVVPLLSQIAFFCKKTKYKAKSKTREKTHGCLEFRSDKKLRDSVLLHIKKCTVMSEIAQQVLAVCTKDLISSEACFVLQVVCEDNIL